MASANHRALHSALTSGIFAPVYLVSGSDEHRKDSLVRALVDAAVGPSMRDFNLDVVRGGEVSAEQLGSLLGTPPMMADRRVVVLRDVTALKKDARTELEGYLVAPARDTVLIVVAASGAKLDKVFEAIPVHVDLGELSEAELPGWIAQQVIHAGGTEIEPSAIALLQDSVGADAGALASELDKLVSYCRGRVITARDVADVVGVTPGHTVSDFFDAVAARDSARALAAVPGVLSIPKSTLVSIIIGLTAQTLALSYGKAARDRGLGAHLLEKEYYGLLKETGAFPMRPWGEAVKCWSKYLAQWDRPSLDRALRALRAADQGAKDTRVSNDEQLLANLVCTLCARAA